MHTVVQTSYTVTTSKTLSQGGYRIVYLSDLHYGTVQDTQILAETLEKINSLQPDLVLLGGDIVDEGTTLAYMQEVFATLGSLESTFGIYFIYGNHDRQVDTFTRTYTDSQLVQAIERSGIQILEDEVLEIGEDLLLIGRADASWTGTTSRKSIDFLLYEQDPQRFIITLDHQPLAFQENNKAGVDLLLSGHTHGGQIWPIGTLCELVGKPSYGLYQQGQCTAIVSSGFAGWGYGIRTQGHCEYVVVHIQVQSR